MQISEGRQTERPLTVNVPAQLIEGETQWHT